MDFIRENLNVFLVIAGLLLAAAGSIVEKLAPEHKRFTRAALVIMALIGFAVTAFATYRQEHDNQKERQDISTANEEIGRLIDPSQGLLTDVSAKLTQIEAELRVLAPQHGAPLPSADTSTSSEKYFVQIAADTSRERLEPYVSKLQRKFGISNDFVGIVEIPSSAVPYRLAFGQRLDKATALKYAGVANNLNLPPPGQSASIQQQPQ